MKEPEGQWVPAFQAGPVAAKATATAAKECRKCKAMTGVLHSIAPHIEREYCGKCQGESNQRLLR